MTQEQIDGVSGTTTPSPSSIEVQPAELPVQTAPSDVHVHTSGSGVFTSGPSVPSSKGLTIAVILVLLVIGMIAALGWFMMHNMSDKAIVPSPTENVSQTTGTGEAQVINTGDAEIDQLSNEINAPVTVDMESDLQKIDAEF